VAGDQGPEVSAWQKLYSSAVKYRKNKAVCLGSRWNSEEVKGEAARHKELAGMLRDLCKTAKIWKLTSWSANSSRRAGFGVPCRQSEAAVPLKAGSERVSASFGFAAKRDIAGSKKIYERE
jgi:hypothetical protein